MGVRATLHVLPVSTGPQELGMEVREVFRAVVEGCGPICGCVSFVQVRLGLGLFDSSQIGATGTSHIASCSMCSRMKCSVEAPFMLMAWLNQAIITIIVICAL